MSSREWLSVLGSAVGGGAAGYGEHLKGLLSQRNENQKQAIIQMREQNLENLRHQNRMTETAEASRLTGEREEAADARQSQRDKDKLAWEKEKFEREGNALSEKEKEYNFLIKITGDEALAKELWTKKNYGTEEEKITAKEQIEAAQKAREILDEGGSIEQANEIRRIADLPPLKVVEDPENKEGGIPLLGWGAKPGTKYIPDEGSSNKTQNSPGLLEPKEPSSPNQAENSKTTEGTKPNATESFDNKVERAMARINQTPTKKEDYGLRTDGTPKGTGYLGELKRPDGDVSTELSVSVSFDGKERLIPTLVPSLTSKEVNHLLNGGEPTDVIMQKAVTHARERIKEGKSPFAEEGEGKKGLLEEEQKANYNNIYEKFLTLDKATQQKCSERADEIYKMAIQQRTPISKQSAGLYAYKEVVEGEPFKLTAEKVQEIAKEAVDIMGEIPSKTRELSQQLAGKLQKAGQNIGKALSPYFQPIEYPKDEGYYR